ncbi:MAG TPA: hypothetical protein PK025_08170 [Spirochaetales bacterium]|nr:hypothetical protein [Spirochaetales bacterium]HOT58896.1 hypothetical protein [Spirochaetales bacterium]HPD81010.1 hypothetical protein [Spirochaetales bacterium]HQG39775.1 hypothetical protein [Spirochaetales bacterium]
MGSIPTSPIFSHHFHYNFSQAFIHTDESLITAQLTPCSKRFGLNMFFRWRYGIELSVMKLVA